MKVVDTGLADVRLIELDVFRDERGFFLESFQARRHGDLPGLNGPFVQDNYTHSHQHVLRGLHVQTRHPQGKLIRVLRGEIFDVAVDLRAGSRDFGRWQATVLTESQPAQLWIPPGFAHGFVVLSDGADVEYKCTEYYRPEYEVCLRWNDVDLAVDWPVKEPVLSLRDQAGLAFRGFQGIAVSGVTS